MRVSKQHYRGFMLVEATIALLLISAIALWQLKDGLSTAESAFGKTAGEQVRVIGAGLSAYATNYAPQVIANGTVTGVAVTRAPTVAELVTLGLVPANASATAVNGGSLTASLSVTPAGCVSPNCNISGYVVNNRPLAGGNSTATWNPVAVGAALNAMGTDGGASTINGATISGPGGAWSIANPVAGQPVGIIAYRVGTDSTQFAQFLRRDGTLPMTGKLDMGGQNLTNLPTVTVGNACAVTGDLAKSATGAVLSCQGSVWQPQGSMYWVDPVPNFASLPACNAATQWQTRMVEVPTVGSGPRIYTCDGAAWQALAVNDAGNLVVANSIQVGNTGVGGASSSSASGRLATGALELKQQVTVGAACAPNGAVATDSSGSILSCQSGIWSALGGGLGVGQTWNNLTSIRTAGTSYVNGTSKPIEVAISGVVGGPGSWCDLQLNVGGVLFYSHSGGNGYSQLPFVSAVVPSGTAYSAAVTNCSIIAWNELR